jgi:hypothetical protein
MYLLSKRVSLKLEAMLLIFAKASDMHTQIPQAFVTAICIPMITGLIHLLWKSVLIVQIDSFFQIGLYIIFPLFSFIDFSPLYPFPFLLKGSVTS